MFTINFKIVNGLTWLSMKVFTSEVDAFDYAYKTLYDTAKFTAFAILLDGQPITYHRKA
jgi:hypothetical protein